MTATRSPRGVRLAQAAWLTLAIVLGARMPWAVERADIGNDFGAYHAAAQALVDARDPGQARSARNADYLYPPAFAVLITPLARLPEHVGGFIWLGLNLALIAVIGLQLRRALTQRHRLLAFAIPMGALVVGANLTHELLNGQIDLLVLAACLACVIAVQQGRSVRAGITLAAAVAAKVTPLFLIVWLVMRRAWRAAAVFAIALPLLMVLLPAPFLGLQGSLDANRAWVERVAAPYLSQAKTQTSDERPPEQRYGAGYSLRGILLRSLTDEPVDYDGSTRGNWVAWPRSVAFGLYAALSLLLVLCFCHTLWRAPSPGDALGEASLCLAIMVVIAPLSHSANFLALWPAAAWLLQVGGRAERVAVAVAAALLILPEPLPLDIRAALLGGGVHVAAALLLAVFVRKRLLRGTGTSARAVSAQGLGAEG